MSRLEGPRACTPSWIRRSYRCGRPNLPRCALRLSKGFSGGMGASSSSALPHSLWFERGSGRLPCAGTILSKDGPSRNERGSLRRAGGCASGLLGQGEFPARVLGPISPLGEQAFPGCLPWVHSNLIRFGEGVVIVLSVNTLSDGLFQVLGEPK